MAYKGWYAIKSNQPTTTNVTYKCAGDVQKVMYKHLLIQNLYYITNKAFWLVGWLVGWLGLWHVNLCRLFNAKSIFMKIVSSVSNNSV